MQFLTRASSSRRRAKTVHSLASERKGSASQKRAKVTTKCVDRKSGNMTPQYRPFPKSIWRTAQSWTLKTVKTLADHAGLLTERMEEKSAVENPWNPIGRNAVQKPWVTILQQQDFCQNCLMPFEYDLNPKTVNSTCGHLCCRACIRARKWARCFHTCHMCNKRIGDLVSSRRLLSVNSNSRSKFSRCATKRPTRRDSSMSFTDWYLTHITRDTPCLTLRTQECWPRTPVRPNLRPGSH